MANLEQIIDKLNDFLVRQGLTKIAGTPTDLETLYGSVLTRIWQNPDRQKRENLAFTVAGELKKYFGGKNLEEIYNKTKIKLDAQEAAAAAKTNTQTGETRRKDPNHVPTFEELFGK
jgi:hypothetical protein